MTVEPVDFNLDAIDRFLVLDRLGTIAGVVLLVLANALVFREPGLWLLVPFLLALAAGLSVGRKALRDGRPTLALVLASVLNWLVAIAVSALLPVLWPVMAVNVVMPMVLATPYLSRQRLAALIATGMLIAAVVAGTGLLNDDGGVIPDLDDNFELVLVVGALTVQIGAIALLVAENNRAQQLTVDRLRTTNVELERSRAELTDSRRRVVDASDQARRQIERDLHDGAQQQLVAHGVRLRLLASQQEGESATAVAALIDEFDEAIDSVRSLAHGIYPPLLQSSGVGPALRAVARRSPQEVMAEIDEVERLDPAAEATLYFVALEALANAAKHAGGADVRIALEQSTNAVTVTVADNGPGFAHPNTGGHGLANMADRVAAAGGELSVDSMPGRGVRVRATMPRLGNDTISA